MISEREAIEVARAFLTAEQLPGWDEGSVAVRSDTVEGHRAWVVSALEAIPPGDEAWMRGDHEPVSYFVTRESGNFFGFEVRGSRTIFSTYLPRSSN